METRVVATGGFSEYIQLSFSIEQTSAHVWSLTETRRPTPKGRQHTFLDSKHTTSPMLCSDCAPVGATRMHPAHAWERYLVPCTVLGARKDKEPVPWNSHYCGKNNDSVAGLF